MDHGMEILIPVSIYLLVLLDLLVFAFKYPPVSDRKWEYLAYIELIEGKRPEGLIKACPMITYLPMVLNKYFRIGRDTAFKITPCFFFALTPVFCYLTAREYLDIWGSLVAVLFICSDFYFTYYPNIGRMAAAIGWLSGVVWLLITGHPLLAVPFGLMVMLSHYNTSIFMLGLTFAAVFGSIIR